MAFDSSIRVFFGGDVSALKASVATARSIVAPFAKEIAAIGSVGAFVGLAKQAVGLASNLTDVSTQLGINVTSLQALQAAAINTGVAENELAMALQRTRLFAQEAAEGGEKQLEVLRKLGINAQLFASVPLDKKFELIAKAARDSRDQSEAFNAVADIFGAKVGPKMTTLLNEAARGMGTLSKEAKDAGLVMEESTIAALDRAGDAIEAFKKRVTIAVGSIIVNFRTEEGLTLLMYQFLKIAGTFGARIVDAISEANDFLGAVFTGTFRGVVNVFQDNLVKSIKTTADLLNRLLPDRFEIDTQSLQRFQSSGLSIAEEISRAIAETKPATFTQEVGKFWDSKIAEQQKVVDALNKAEFAKDIKALTTAADAAGINVDKAAARLENAAANMAQVGENVKQMTSDLRGVGITGFGSPTDRANASDQALRQKMQQLETRLLDVRKNDGGRYDLASGIQAATLGSEIELIKRELKARGDIRRNVESFGIEGARSRFQGDPFKFDQLVQRYTAGLDKQDKTNELLEKLNANVKNVLVNG